MCKPKVMSGENPIDDFYTHSAFLISQGNGANFQAEPELASLLLLGLVSATELYFRSVLASLLETCSVARKEAETQVLSLAAADYYEKGELGFALLEQRALSSGKEVKNATQKLTGLSIPAQSSVDVALDGYDRICHLRHAAVHSRGGLGAQNVRALDLVDLPRSELGLDVIKFQQLVVVSHNAVRSFNEFLFWSTLNRWLTLPVLVGDWQQDREKFSKLHQLFLSKRDALGPATAYSAYRKVKGSIRT